MHQFYDQIHGGRSLSPFTSVEWEFFNDAQSEITKPYHSY